jgi:hypothetical protein
VAAGATTPAPDAVTTAVPNSTPSDLMRIAFSRTIDCRND